MEEAFVFHEDRLKKLTLSHSQIRITTIPQKVSSACHALPQGGERDNYKSRDT